VKEGGDKMTKEEGKKEGRKEGRTDGRTERTNEMKEGNEKRKEVVK
jgi:hypothetical protein